jgi:cellulose 1,4-beta-cellobiosidase
LPIRASRIRAGTVITSWSTTQPRGRNVYNVTYDNWFNQTPTTSGHPYGAELMIWLNHHGNVNPAGSQIASDVSIGGHSYNVWLRQWRWNTITYEMTTGATSVTNLDLQPLVADAVTRGYVSRSWYLISVEAGFELWRAGTGLATNSFSVNVASGG